MTFARSRNDGSTSTVDGADGDTLYAPFRPDTLRSAIVSAIERCTAIDGNTVAFLPAKAGSGASTTALNVAGSLAPYWRQNVLLIETDLHSGCLSVALQLEPAHTIVEVLAENGLEPLVDGRRATVTVAASRRRRENAAIDERGVSPIEIAGARFRAMDTAPR